METTKRKRTREEVRAAVRETIRRKKEWIEESNAFLERIYQQRLAEQS
ncbi:MAG: 30S ribosomal protein S7 [Prevotella sp.]|nr:30S ribosomal protein S7 [Prevotella sp.]